MITFQALSEPMLPCTPPMQVGQNSPATEDATANNEFQRLLRERQEASAAGFALVMMITPAGALNMQRPTSPVELSQTFTCPLAPAGKGSPVIDRMPVSNGTNFQQEIDFFPNPAVLGSEGNEGPLTGNNPSRSNNFPTGAANPVIHPQIELAADPSQQDQSQAPRLVQVELSTTVQLPETSIKEHPPEETTGNDAPSAGELPALPQPAGSLVDRRVGLQDSEGASFTEVVDTTGTEWVQSLVDRLQTYEQQGKTALRVQLKPEQLGKIEIELSRSPEGLRISISTEQALTGQMLEGQFSHLRQVLAEAGIHLAHFDVRQQASGQPKHAPRDREFRQRFSSRKEDLRTETAEFNNHNLSEIDYRI